MNNILSELIENRLSDLSKHNISLTIDVNKNCSSLLVSSKKIMCLSSFEIHSPTGEISHGHVSNSGENTDQENTPSSLKFLAKWTKDNNYWYKVSFEVPVLVSSIKIASDTRFPSTGWIFDSEVIIVNEHNESYAVKPADEAYKTAISSLEEEFGNESEKSPLGEIVTNCLFQKNANQTFDLFKASEDTLEIDYQDLMQYTFPMVLTSHGYTVSLNNSEKEGLIGNLDGFVSDFREIGYEIFVNSGTLLGAVREGDFIPHDDDVDFAIVLKSTSKEDVVQEIWNLENTLRSKGLIRGFPIGHKDGICHWKLKYVNSTSVDLFPCWIEDNKVYVWPYCFGMLDKEALLPMNTVSISGNEFPAPRLSEEFLKMNYGDNWAIPDPLFKFNWKKSASEFREYLKLLRAPHA